MNNKDRIDLENLYSKILTEAKDLEHHNHSFNEPTKGNNHTPYPDTSNSLESTIEDEDEDNVKNTEEVEFEDLNDRDDDDEFLGDDGADSGEEEVGVTIKGESTDLLNVALEIINEAKKTKVNPWAIENSIEKRYGKHFSKKKKESIVNKIKKNAKKSGEEITSKPVKKKKK